MTIVFADTLNYSNNTQLGGGGWPTNQYGDLSGSSPTIVRMNEFSGNFSHGVAAVGDVFTYGFEFAIDASVLSSLTNPITIAQGGDEGAGTAFPGIRVQVDVNGTMEIYAPINGTMTSVLSSSSGAIVGGTQYFLEVSYDGSGGTTSGNIKFSLNGTQIASATGLAINEGHAVGGNTTPTLTTIDFMSSASGGYTGNVSFGNVYVSTSYTPNGSFPVNAPLQVTSVYSANNAVVSTFTVDYNNAWADEIIYLVILSEPNAGSALHVSSVTDSNSLTWTRRVQQDINNASPSTYGTMETWWARASSAGSGTITVTWPSNIDAAVLYAVSLSGCVSTGTPFDGNASIPAIETNATASNTTPSQSVSTNSTDTVALGIYGCLNNNYNGTASGNPQGSWNLPNSDNSTHTNYVAVSGMTSSFLSAQSSTTIALSNSGNSYIYLVEAFTNVAAGAIMNTTENPDIARFVGYPNYPGPYGDLQATENADTFSAIGHQPVTASMTVQENTDSFSAYGRQPLQGTWSSTEKSDAFSGTGVGYGENASMTVTEAVDGFSASGYSTAFATFNTTEAPDRFLAVQVGATRTSARRIFFVT